MISCIHFLDALARRVYIDTLQQATKDNQTILAPSTCNWLLHGLR